MSGGESVIDELRYEWGARPTGFCHCGCGERTKSFFYPSHDSKYAARLLRELRENPEVARAIRRLSDRSEL